MAERKSRTEFFEGVDGKFYWRHRHWNGNITMTGGEGYSTKSNCRRAIRKAGLVLLTSSIVEVHPDVKPGDYRG